MWAVKSLKLCNFNGILLSKEYKILDEKVQKCYASWHWRVMQSLRKNWLLVSNVTWGIWWTLMQAVASLKICNLMCYFCRKYIMFETKKIQRSYVSWHWRMMQNLRKNRLWKNDMRNLGNFDLSTWQSQSLHFNGFLLSKVYNVWAKKLRGSWQWGLMQYFNKKIDWWFEKWLKGCVRYICASLIFWV